MARLSVATGIIVLGGMCFAACFQEALASRPDSALPIAESVGAHSLVSATSGPPAVAVSARGTVYVVWEGKGRDNAPRPAGFPLIPEQYTSISALPKSSPVPRLSVVPGLSIYRDARWSEPELLVEGQRYCRPLHAWCVGESLHLIVAGLSRDQCYHLELQPGAAAWQLKAKLPFTLSHSPLRTIGEQVHIAFSKGMFVHYVCFDGREWSEPLAIEASRNETRCVTRARLAVDNDGVAHVMWWAADENGVGVHGYAALSDGKVEAESVDFAESPIEQEAFDLGILPDGRLFVAYKARLPKNDQNATKLHIRCRQNGAWTKATQIKDKSDELFGQVYTAWSRDAAFVSWLVGDDYPTGGGGFMSAGFRRCATFDGTAWSKSRWMAMLPPRGGNSIPAGPLYMGMCVDTHDRLHVSWQGGAYARVADLSSSRDAKGESEQASPGH